MKKGSLSKKMTCKEAIDRCDAELIRKGKTRLLFMLPATEKDYARSLLEDATIRKMMKLLCIFYFIFRKPMLNCVVETQGADFMLEEGDTRHDGEAILEAMQYRKSSFFALRWRRPAKLFEGNRKATARRSMKISVFFYASTQDQKAKNARRPMGGSVGDLRANLASFAIFASEQGSRKEDFCMSALRHKKGI